jgi:hypothetical protein
LIIQFRDVESSAFSTPRDRIVQPNALHERHGFALF